jgi:hypothetical protein
VAIVAIPIVPEEEEPFLRKFLKGISQDRKKLKVPSSKSTRELYSSLVGLL